jgi:hypothetical protein
VARRERVVVADEQLRRFERRVATGDETDHDFRILRISRGLCPFCGSDKIEEWDVIEFTITDGGLPVDGLEKVSVPGYICIACAGPSKLAMHWAVFERDGLISFTRLDVIALVKPGRYGVPQRLGKNEGPAE